MKSIRDRDQTRRSKTIWSTSVYDRNFDSLPDSVLYDVLRAKQYLKSEFIVELASRCANLGKSL